VICNEEDVKQPTSGECCERVEQRSSDADRNTMAASHYTQWYA